MVQLELDIMGEGITDHHRSVKIRPGSRADVEKLGNIIYAMFSLYNIEGIVITEGPVTKGEDHEKA